MSIISWGKPRIFIAKLGVDNAVPEKGAEWKEFPTPKEDTTELSTEKGDKVEATIEGGESIDAKYKKSAYSLTFELYRQKGLDLKTATGVDVHDGVVEGRWAVYVQPEDPENDGIKIDCCTISVEDKYTAADGSTQVFTFEALKPKIGDIVKHEVVAVMTT